MDEQSRVFAQQLAENSLRNVHPLTCGDDRGDQAHREYQAIHGGDLGELVKTENGMECPVCGWKQPPSVHEHITQLTAENERLKRVVEQALVFIECTASDLHNRRCTDWYPEGAQNAASQMSEDMRLIGNAMIEAVAQLKREADRG